MPTIRNPISQQLEVEKVTGSIFVVTNYYDQIAWFKDAQRINNLNMGFAGGGNYNFVCKALASRLLTNNSFSFILSVHMPLLSEFKL